METPQSGEIDDVRRVDPCKGSRFVVPGRADLACIVYASCIAAWTSVDLGYSAAFAIGRSLVLALILFLCLASPFGRVARRRTN